AGEAYTQFPLTTDYSAANLFIDAVETDMVPTPGTSLRSAIKQALESFDFKTPSTKVIVLITDGENTEGDALTATKEAAEKGVIIYTIGMGSQAGVPIPIYDTTGQHDFKRDANGNVVVTRLDELSLEKIATTGHGVYYRATNAVDELGEVYKKINGLQKHQFGVKQITDFEDRFQFFIGFGILLLLLELFISENKVLWLAKWNPTQERDPFR
ncbi:MAG: VWA domain-containing protein, partial [Nitrospirae bacterium]|nr:VWA domain-containing protein [Candidatus Troglogloeales bacterium]